MPGVLSGVIPSSQITSQDIEKAKQSKHSNKTLQSTPAPNPVTAPVPNSPQTSPQTHHKVRDDVSQLINDVVDETVDELGKGIGVIEGNFLSFIGGNDLNSEINYGTIQSSSLPKNTSTPHSTRPTDTKDTQLPPPPSPPKSRVLGARGLVRSVEDHLEDDIINEASPLLHRLEEPFLNNDPEGPPSDPSQNPLDTLSVRGLRILLYILTVAWSGWISLLIINVFAHIPWLDEPSVSSAFTQLDMALMSLAEVISSLMFYRFPAQADRGVEYVTAGIVLLDLVVVLSVPSQREKNGSRGGLITTVGSLVTFILAPVTDKVVEYTKKREQELVRGDEPEQRKSFNDYVRMVVMFCTRGLILLSVALISTNMVIESYDMAYMDPPGDIIPIRIGGNTTTFDLSNSIIDVHIYCTEISNIQSKSRPAPPSRNVTILAEAGESSSYEFSSWMLELYEKGQLYQVCYWDRPGFGFSDQAPSPLSAGVVADILFDTLDQKLTNASESKYVLVSHGVGGLYSRIFASRHSPSIHSLVLVDNLHEDLFYKRNSSWQGFKYWIQGVLSSFGYRNVFNMLIFRDGPFDRIYGSSQKHQPKYYFAKLQEQLSARTTTKAEIIESNASLDDDIPIVVISSSKSIRTDKEWSDKQRLLTKLTKNTLAWEVLEGPHDLWKHESTKEKLQQLLLDDISYARRA